MFLLHRTQGGGQLCNALGRDGHMLLLRKLNSHSIIYGIMRMFSPVTSFFTSMDLHLAFYQLFSTSYRRNKKESLTYSETLSVNSVEKDQLCAKKHTPTKSMTGEKKSYVSQKSQI